MSRASVHGPALSASGIPVMPEERSLRIAAMLLGIVGGGMGVVVPAVPLALSLGAFRFGPAAAAQTAALLSAVVGILAAAEAGAHPKLAGVLMLAAAVSGTYTLGVAFVLPAVMLATAGILSLTTTPAGTS